VENSGRKSLVFFGQSAYIFYVRFNYFLPTFREAVKIPVLIQGTVIRGANSARPALGSINVGTPLTDRLVPGTVGIDLLLGVCCWLAMLWIMGVPC
jgi:hypothetical protein